MVCLKVLLRRASKLTQKWNEAINDDQLRQDLVKILVHIRDTPIIPQECAVIPANHSLAKLNASGDGSEQAASNTLHVLSVSDFDKSKKSNLVMASQKLGTFSVPIHELLGSLKAITSADEYISTIPAILKSETNHPNSLGLYSCALCVETDLRPSTCYPRILPE